MTLLTRRLLLAAPALLVPRRAAAAMLQPGHATGLNLDPAEPDQVAFSADDIIGAVMLPQGRARLVALLPIAGRDVAAVAFAADPPGGTLDLLALIGWDGACLRVLGLEVLNYSGPNGASLSSRFAGVGDRSRISIARTASTPRRGLPKRWENWIDYLAWRDGAPLADAAIRTPLAGTRQADLGAIRAEIITALSPPCQAVTAALLVPVHGGFDGLILAGSRPG
jgi:hypothetical protein